MTRDDPGNDAFPAIVIGAAVLLGGPAAVMWCGAWLAAKVTGGRFSAGAGDAVEALFRVRSHLSDPAHAWRRRIARQLPGGVAYWACTLLVAALVIAALVTLVLLVVRHRRGVGTLPRRPLGVDGRARFATSADLAPLYVTGPAPGRFILGRVGRRLVATETRTPTTGGSRRRWRRRRPAHLGDRGAVALIGPSRCGKTVAAISGILEWEGPAVLSSVKADLLTPTRGWRSQIGDVAVYDPTGNTGVASAAWSPLRSASTTTGAQRAARSLCHAAPRDGTNDLDFWLAQAEILLTGLLWVAAMGHRDMAAVCNWVMLQDRPSDLGPGEVKATLDSFLAVADDAVRVDAEQAARTLFSIWQMEDRTRSSVYATAQTVVWPWADPGVAAAARGQSIDLEWLLSGANTVYLCAPIEDQARLAPAFGGLLNDLIKQAYLRYNATGRPLDPPLLVVIDEAGNTPLKALPEYASTLAGIGVLLVTVWQSVAQIEAGYRRHADTILTNHLSKVFYSGLSDPASLKFVEAVLGNAELETLSHSAGPFGDRASLQRATTHTPLAPAHVLRQMIPGDALLIHGTLPPAHLRTRPYYAEAHLLDRAQTPPLPSQGDAPVPGTAPNSVPGGAPPAAGNAA